MSDPYGRHGRPAGSSAADTSTWANAGSASPNAPLPGQPWSETRTERVPDRPEADETTSWPVYSPAQGQPAPPREYQPVSFWDDDKTGEPAPGATAGPDDQRQTGPVPTGTDPSATRPDYSARPVAVRRPDVLAGLLLLLAGIAAGVSLLVVWVDGGVTGLDLVRNGLDDAGSGPGQLADTGTWQPLVIVGGGAVLLLLGLLLFTPARTHRFLGAVALLVTLAVTAGVLVPLADVHWRFDRFAVGFFFAVAVAGLGALGSLKALITGPR